MGVPSQGLVEFRLGPLRVPPRVLSLRRWIVGAVVLVAVRWRAVGLSVLMAFVSGTVRLKSEQLKKRGAARASGRRVGSRAVRDPRESLARAVPRRLGSGAGRIHGAVGMVSSLLANSLDRNGIVACRRLGSRAVWDPRGSMVMVWTDKLRS